MSLTITLIGGPTALIEFDGFRLLTDPTFDHPGAYKLPHVTLENSSVPRSPLRKSARLMRCCSVTISTPTILIIPGAISCATRRAH
jgi:L-ascorbate metabolism protein UlaG (beta-lactamase superfamily)